MHRLRGPLVSLNLQLSFAPRAIRSRAGTFIAEPGRVCTRETTLPDEGGSDMPQKAWSAKRERQYEHIKEGLKDHGRSEDLAEEIAARTVNKERARSGEARTASSTSTRDMSSSRRGGQRSHRGAQGPTYAQLYSEARSRGIKGRSSMSKAQLARALGR
jgi:hypothetical protein